MDVSRKVDLVARNSLEVITRDDAEEVFQTNASPRGYLGFEPSGMFHLGWMIWVNKFKDMMDAGIKMTLLEATWHAWINDKFGGDMSKIQSCTTYIEHCLRALGVDLDRVDIVKADAMVGNSDYWEGIIKVGKALSLSRVKRAVTIMGRKEDETQVDFSKLIYPCMQVEDIFYLKLDFVLGGMDQRRAHVLAREVAGHYGFRKPVAIHTPLLSGLQGAGRMDMAGDADAAMIDCKMSKSKPETCIFIHDQPEQIRAKLNNAYCPPKEVEGNPVIEIARYILMRDAPLTVTRPAKYGGDISFETADGLINTYREGGLHPMDLKGAVANGMVSTLAHVRDYFKRVPEAAEAMAKMGFTERCG